MLSISTSAMLLMLLMTLMMTNAASVSQTNVDLQYSGALRAYNHYSLPRRTDGVLFLTVSVTICKSP